MAIKCKNGHWYDPNMYKNCPHCKRAGEQLRLTLDDVQEDDRTVSIADVDVSLGEQLELVVGKDVGSLPDQEEEQEDTDRTVSFGFWGLRGDKPVTGWLVCMSGDEKGQDYRLHAGRNFIGRGASMDVALIEDKSVARQRHCSVIYEPKGNVFYLMPEQGNIVYYNGEMTEGIKILKTGDSIRIGETSLIFIPFCQEGITWEK